MLSFKRATLRILLLPLILLCLVAAGARAGVASKGAHAAHLAPGHASEPGELQGTLSFEFTDIGTLPGSAYEYSQAFALNRYGHVGGTSSGIPVVFIDGTLLDALPGASGGVSEINDDGILVVNAGLPILVRGHATLTLPGLGGQTYAYSLNDAAEAVGLSRLPSGVARPILWRGGTLTDLGTFVPGVRGAASDINNRGVIVGSSEDGAGFGRPVKWVNGQIVALGTADGSTVGGIARAINEFGDIVGESAYSGPSGSGVVATLWRSDGAVRGLRFLDDTPPATSRAYDINGQGLIVGESGSSAFLWVDDRMHDLNDVPQIPDGWHLSVARDINDRGQIVGTAYSPTGGLRGFLLTPTN